MRYYVRYGNGKFVIESCVLMISGPETSETVKGAKTVYRKSLVSRIDKLEKELKEKKKVLKLFDKTADKLQLKD